MSLGDQPPSAAGASRSAASRASNIVRSVAARRAERRRPSASSDVGRGGRRASLMAAMVPAQAVAPRSHRSRARRAEPRRDPKWFRMGGTIWKRAVRSRRHVEPGTASIDERRAAARHDQTPAGSGSATVVGSEAEQRIGPGPGRAVVLADGPVAGRLDPQRQPEDLDEPDRRRRGRTRRPRRTWRGSCRTATSASAARRRPPTRDRAGPGPRPRRPAATTRRTRAGRATGR